VNKHNEKLWATAIKDSPWRNLLNAASKAARKFAQSLPTLAAEARKQPCEGGTQCKSEKQELLKYFCCIFRTRHFFSEKSEGVFVAKSLACGV